MTEPAGDMAAGAAGGGRLRASHADREQVIDVLKAAFVQARLTKDEFDSRITQALASRTSAELAVVTAGIPAAPSGVQPSRHPVRARVRHRVNPDLRSDVRVVVAACPIAAASWLATVPAGDNFVTMPLLLLVAFTATVAALRSFVRGAIVLVESWLQKRPGWQPVPPPEPGEWLLNIKAGRLVPCLVASILCCRKTATSFLTYNTFGVGYQGLRSPSARPGESQSGGAGTAGIEPPRSRWPWC